MCVQKARERGPILKEKFAPLNAPLKAPLKTSLTLIQHFSVIGFGEVWLKELSKEHCKLALAAQKITKFCPSAR